jgi:hypothetical protein
MKVIKPASISAGAFSRDSAGALQVVGVDVARVTFDYATDICTGVLIEVAATNLQTYSSQLNGPSWAATGVTVVADAATAPDGTLTLDQIVEGSGSGTHALTSSGKSVTAGLAYTFSAFVKAGVGSRYIGISPGGSPQFSSTAVAVFDPSTGLFTSTGGCTCAVASLAGGVYRISATATATGTGSATCSLSIVKPSASSSYTGDGASSQYFWGAQFEQGALSSYIPSDSSPGVRAADASAGGLVYSNLVDADAAYVAGTPYNLNERVTYDKVIWECILAPSLGNTPSTSPTFWLNRGPSNRWAAFDSQVSTASTATGEQIYVLQPGYASGLGAFGLIGSSIEVSVLSEPGGPILSSTKFLLDGAVISDWYQYYFSEIEQQTDYVNIDLSAYDLSYVTVRIKGSTTSIGHLSLGKVIDLGGSQYGASIGITDYSTKKVDANGVSTFVQKGYAKDLSVSTLFDKAQLNGVYKTLASLRATPCTWIVADELEYSSLTTFGNIRDFSINVEYFSTSLCNFDIQGLSA